ncbi:MAG TPA: hypothetical protein VFR03_13705 [Thermoanaerobaculia bacterium]|nr:hypothetical protein [Thermoanaerobaculia bacterium]
MSYHHRKKRRTRLKKHHRVLLLIATMALILYVYVWEVVGTGWRGIWGRGHQHGWVDATPSGTSGHRR